MTEIVKDQAETLRKSKLAAEVQRKKSTSQKSMESITRVISFTGGKGGVGKTNSVLNVGIGLAQAGKSVLILDADLGLANVDVLLGLKPRYTLQHLFEGTKSLDEITISGPEGIAIIPATSGVEALCTLTQEQRMVLMEAVEEVAYKYDYLLIDTAAGISSEVMYFNSASSEIVCVITPEPTSLTDAYALIKVLSQNYGEKKFSILVNNVRTEASGGEEREALLTFRRFAKAVERFLHIELKYLGFVPSDIAVSESVKSQRALLQAFPSSRAGLALANIAKKIDAEFLGLRVKGGMQFFFKQLLEVSAHG